MGDGKVDFVAFGVFDGEHFHGAVAGASFDDAEVFADAVFDVDDVVSGLDVGGFVDAFLFGEAASVAGVRAALGVVGVEVGFGEEQFVLVGVEGTFVEDAKVKVKLVEAFEGVVEVMEALEGSGGFEVAVDGVTVEGFLAAFFYERVTGCFGLLGGECGGGGLEMGFVGLVGGLEGVCWGGGIGGVDNEGGGWEMVEEGLGVGLG